MSLIIESGIPMPRGRKANHTGHTDQIRAMEVGQSFAIPAGTSKSTVSNLIRQANIPGKFSICKTPDGYRCWRIA